MMEAEPSFEFLKPARAGMELVGNRGFTGAFGCLLEVFVNELSNGFSHITGPFKGTFFCVWSTIQILRAFSILSILGSRDWNDTLAL